MNMFIGIVAFVFMLSIIITIHEFGHFIVARYFAVYCHEFSIGMGPVLYQRKGKETIFSIRVIPLGGYVLMAGEEDGSQNESQDGWLKEVPRDRRLNHKVWWKQVAVMLAGIVMNLVLAWVLFVGIAIARGHVVEQPKPVVYAFTESSVSKDTGIQKGDSIVMASDGAESIKPKTNMELLEWLQYHHDTITLTVKRGDRVFEVALTPSYDKKENVYHLGYKALAYVRPIQWYEGFKIGTENWKQSGAAIFNAFNMLIHGKGYENLSGPVGIFNVTSKSAQLGWYSYLSLFAMISMNIGIFNAIPIPALDGGRILITLLQVIFRRKINQKLVEGIILASFAFLILLFVYATYNDVLRLF